MATNRFQFSDDFVLNNGNVGINTASPQEKLDVVGTVKADNLKVTGISSFTAYDGFLNNNQNITDNVTLSSGTSGSLSGEIVVGTGFTVTVGSAATSSQGNIDSLKVYNNFTVPTGGTEDRPRKVKPGQLYYNNDFKTVEFWDGNVWRQVDNTTTSGRGVFGGGNVEPAKIEYINISTTGNSVNFGSLLFAGGYRTGSSSSTRGLFSGGYATPTGFNSIEYITIASIGNGIDFGDITALKYIGASCSSSTRSLNAGGFVGPTNTNIIDYVEISTLGNAIDFGDLSSARIGLFSTSSPTRGIFAGGGFPTGIPIIEYVTISSVGNAIDFGDLTTQKSLAGGSVSNGVRGVFGSGDCRPGGNNKIIDYVTISTTGNSIEFGESTVGKWYAGACSSLTRGVWGGGVTPSSVNILDYITISSAGNAQDFGDLSRASRIQNAGLSDSHGGLGGF